MKNNKKYGLFYKSRGKWTGPYRNRNIKTQHHQLF